MPDNAENSSKIAELRDILWAHIHDLDQVRLLKRRPSLERRLKVVHALSQLSASYLKVVEVDAVLEAVPALQAQVQQLRQLVAESQHGNGHPTPTLGRN
jgi:hypothetical protein